MGVHTPMPCLPAIVGPWAPGANNTTINSIPAATKDSKCQCSWGGSISVVSTMGLPMTDS
ncbi:hypothetical protein AcidC75_23510 [Acidisoma sp. C75]